MKPAPFAYSCPREVDQALETLAEQGTDAKVLAGGQSLVPLMSMRLAAPSHLVDINRLDELAYVHTSDGEVRVGALARHADVEHDPAAFAAQPLLRRAVELVAHPTIRNAGTSVGSVVHADPAAELPAVLALLDGTVVCRSRDGRREVPAAEFFVGPLESALAPEELAVELRVPASAERSGAAIAEVSRRHGDYALCGVAVTVAVDQSGGTSSARAAYFAVADTPVVVDLSPAVSDGDVDDAALGRAGELAQQHLDPAADIHASADYRRHLVGVLTRRAVRAAYDEAAGDEGR